ncbi:hypothetical protein XAP412_830011 [Xanthomonas phaseoli pv. phaseoli]|uniref:Uncharacterized protein n=1 Tax=Xanthomonas campestris pv. phaseoli TaxID=317013 RepID=A0AB38E5F1_XANCH|nr:hypothetical protein XAP6984_860012 [Xanthomonas phaseoli pv. phaseoli]SON90896.1 hypothetical protein XAP412_830011 [Xanthomonas phaseoli pv. phaseoli]SON92691.1 hypothetical protein XAP7430_830012 [Xanthomonas phaseoli pv. phaseoli]
MRELEQLADPYGPGCFVWTTASSIAADDRELTHEPVHRSVSHTGHRGRQLRFYDSRFPTPDSLLCYSIPSFFSL